MTPRPECRAVTLPTRPPDSAFGSEARPSVRPDSGVEDAYLRRNAHASRGARSSALATSHVLT